MIYKLDKLDGYKMVIYVNISITFIVQYMNKEKNEKVMMKSLESDLVDIKSLGTINFYH